jgi:DNA-binding MarR family transcriptional regulator
MNDTSERAANVLGALGLLVAGLTGDAVHDAVGGGGVLGEALIVIKDQPGCTAEWLAGVLRISQPGTAHVVRKLIEKKWVRRDTGEGRRRPLNLTAAGERAAAKALAARQTVLLDLVGRLSEDQREQLAGIADALLGPAARTDEQLAQLCRQCDRGACPVCPVHAGRLRQQRS